MNEIIKLAEQAFDVWSVGKRIVDQEYGFVRQQAVDKVSGVISSALSLMLLTLSGFAFIGLGFLLLGMWSADYYDNAYLLYITPLGLCLLTMIISWSFRRRLFKSITKELIEENL